SASDIVVVTTPYSAQAATLPPLAAATAGKIVVSTVVPMAFEAGKATLVDVPEGSAAEQQQALLPASTVVGAFQNLGARKLLRGSPMDADVVVCADMDDAKKQIMQLADQIEGARGIDGGPLANAKLVEGITVLLVAVNRAYKVNAGIRIAGVK
ncbi:MAG: NADPH-dependent F420 reductase, partial [Dehalococcoidia bacterium]